jgi:hypothetical protein
MNTAENLYFRDYNHETMEECLYTMKKIKNDTKGIF